MMTILLIGTPPVAFGLAVVPLSLVEVEPRVNYPSDPLHLVHVPCTLINGAFIPDHYSSALPNLVVRDYVHFSFVPAVRVLDIKNLTAPRHWCL